MPLHPMSVSGQLPLQLVDIYLWTCVSVADELVDAGSAPGHSAWVAEPEVH